MAFVENRRPKLTLVQTRPSSGGTFQAQVERTGISADAKYVVRHLWMIAILCVLAWFLHGVLRNL